MAELGFCTLRHENPPAFLALGIKKAAAGLSRDGLVESKKED